MKEMFKSIRQGRQRHHHHRRASEGLEQKGARSTKEELEKLLKEMDVDGNGEVDYEEFIAATFAVNNEQRGQHGARLRLL